MLVMSFHTTYTTVFTDSDGLLATSTIETSVNLPVVVDSQPSDNNKVAIGVGLGVGIPSIFVACVGVYWQWAEKGSANAVVQ
jgi:hypothetical protein